MTAQTISLNGLTTEHSKGMVSEMRHIESMTRKETIAELQAANIQPSGNTSLMGLSNTQLKDMVTQKRHIESMTPQGSSGDLQAAYMQQDKYNGLSNNQIKEMIFEKRRIESMTREEAIAELQSIKIQQNTHQNGLNSIGAFEIHPQSELALAAMSPDQRVVHSIMATPILIAVPMIIGFIFLIYGFTI